VDDRTVDQESDRNRPHASELARAAALFGAGRLDEAAALYRAIAAADPANPVVQANLGSVLHSQGQYDAAVAALTEAVRLAPGVDALRRNLAVCLSDWAVHLQRQGRLDDAIERYRAALAHDQSLSATHNNLGTALLERGAIVPAIAALRGAVALGPTSAEYHFNLGNALRAQGQLDDAIACYRAALAHDRDHVDARLNLATALLDQGALPEALTHYRASVARDPKRLGGYSNPVMAMAYDRAQSARSLRDAARAVGAALARRAGAASSPNRDRDPERGLRLGYVSADFRLHPVGWFIQAPLVHHDRARFDVFCYSDQAGGDALTDTLRGEAGHWRVIHGLPDDAFAALVEQDRIDILIDLAGHSAHNRLAVLARRLAPIQASWIGFPMTTGVAAIDHLIADARLLPPGRDDDVTERVVRLPDVAWCYTPPAFAPRVASLPARASGRVTFGSFNNPAKLNPGVLALWARILARVPDARLLLKFRHLESGGAAARLMADATAAGMAPDRLLLEGASPHPDALAAYGRVDIALDPFPFNGGTTTCEALWMGVPVVTFPGDTIAGRMGASLVAAAGLPDWVARDADAAVGRAVAAANDLDALAALRAGLRSRMAASPLCDGPRFMIGFEAALRDLWRRWCAVG
jgi:predicted O-linked N-acetylglucosamine transferase (SPINDLY family)